MAPSTGNCHLCGRETTKICGNCAEGVDSDGNASQTYYCSKECQTEDFDTHVDHACLFSNARKQLYRGAEVLQELFFTFRQNIFENNIEKTVTDEDGKLHVYLRSIEWDQWPLGSHPDHLKSDLHKKIWLSWQGGGIAVACTHDLLEQLLEGKC
jgi:hypothetical protein